MHPNNAKVKMIAMTIRMISADSLYNAPPAAWQLPGCNNWLEITNRSDSSPDDDVPWVGSSSDDYSLGQIFREIIFTKFFVKMISRKKICFCPFFEDFELTVVYTCDYFFLLLISY